MRHSSPFLLVGLALLFCGCSSWIKPDAVTQGAIFNALLAGQYDGTFTSKEVASWGDLGIGTFDGLDGEMIVVDGQTYQADVKGRIRLLTTYTTPFATLKKFSPDICFQLDQPLTMDLLKAEIDRRIPDKNHVYAIRVTGKFSAVTVRSVPRQNKPYPLLTEVVKTQPVFEHRDLTGDVVGFRVPEYAQGINVAGYHFHFLNQAKDVGGHVLALETAGVQVSLDRANGWHIMLPDNDAFRSWDGKGQGADAVKAVESKVMK
jgi:acetolactate decarboxylase